MDGTVVTESDRGGSAATAALDVPARASSARHVPRKLWLAYLCVTGAVAAAYFLLPTTPISKLVLYNGVGLSAVVALLWGTRRQRPENRRAWYLFAAGQLSFVTADVIFYSYQDIFGVESPFPSIADVFYLGMYPLVIAGLLSLMRTVAPGRDWSSLIDAAIVATTVFVLSWVSVMDSYVTDGSLSILERTISIAYPVMDVIMLAVIVRLAATVRTWNPTLLFVTGSLGSLMIADAAYGITQLAGVYQTGSPIDAFWLGFYVLFGAAALHPSMRNLSATDEVEPTWLTPRRALALTLTTLAVPVVDLVWANDQFADQVVTTLGAMILFSLVLARVMNLVKALEANRERLRYDALHDALTGLANRVLFRQRVDEALAADDGAAVAVLFIDLDDFKTVNDSLGHQAGDALLIEVASRLRHALRAEDTPARLGGDEFAVLLDGSLAHDDAVSVAERILAALDAPVEVDGRTVTPAASVGVAVQPRRAGATDVLLRSADVAMYLAKGKGKNRFELFEDSMYAEVVERLELKADLQGALDRAEFELHYQPIMDLAGRVIVGIEALLRWNHPTKGMIAPNRFIPLAEETGLIVPIGRWVLREACVQTQRWRDQHPDGPALSVSVNLSVRQLHHPGLVEDVASALGVSGLAPQDLTLEITESILMRDGELGAHALRRLKALDVKLAIDDFGTGYSSLSYIQRFPIDALKIDRSFVKELGQGPNSSALVRSVIELAGALSITAVAEGIEDGDQLGTLTDLECPYGQGFYFSKPLTVDDLGTMLERSALTASAPGETELRPVRIPLPGVLASEVFIEVHEGPNVLELLGPELDELHLTTGVPVTARRRWLERWIETNPDARPVAVVARNRYRRRLDGVALLALHERPHHFDVTGLGHGAGGCTRLPARGPVTSAALSSAVTHLLGTLAKPWRLNVEQLEGDDPTAALLADLLPHVHLLPDLRVPRVRLAVGTDLDTFLSKNMRKQLRRARSRIEANGMTFDLAFERRREAIAGLLDEVEVVHRRRDHDLRRESDLDDDAMRRFWRDVILDHNRTHEVELVTLRLGGELAAYVVALLDGESYRVLDGRFDPAFAAYSPGRLVEAAALERALHDPALREVDWMSGLGADKLLTANASLPRARLVGTNSLEGVGCDHCSGELDAELAGTAVEA